VPKYRYYGQHLLTRCHHLHSPPHGHIQGLGYTHSSSHPPVTQTQPRRDEITVIPGEKAPNAVFETCSLCSAQAWTGAPQSCKESEQSEKHFLNKDKLEVFMKLQTFFIAKLLQPPERNRDAEAF